MKFYPQIKPSYELLPEDLCLTLLSPSEDFYAIMF